MGSDVLATSFDSDTESHEGRLSHSGVGGAHVDLELGRKDREDLLGRECLSESVETSECELNISYHSLERDTQLTLDGESSSASSGSSSHPIGRRPSTIGLARLRDWTLDFLLQRQLGPPRARDDLLSDDPSEDVQSTTPHLILYLLVGSDTQEELSQLGDVLGYERCVEDQQSLKDIVTVLDTLIISITDCLT
jgi:hypothetical protein